MNRRRVEMLEAMLRAARADGAPRVDWRCRLGWHRWRSFYHDTDHTDAIGREVHGDAPRRRSLLLECRRKPCRAWRKTVWTEGDTRPVVTPEVGP